MVKLIIPHVLDTANATLYIIQSFIRTLIYIFKGEKLLLTIMTLSLTRIDYMAVGSTSRGTTRLLPTPDPKQQTQRFVVGDHDGILHICGVKKDELQIIFKSLPGPKVNGISLGGVLGTQKDKIFVAVGNSVKGYTRRGKVFLEFDTNLLEPISAMCVLGPDLSACAKDLYHRYHDCRDADAYLVGERVMDVLLLPGEGSAVVAVLACGDCAVRVLHSGRTPTLLRLTTIPTILMPYREADVESKDRILVGTTDGRVGLLTLQRDKTLRVTWLLSNNGAEITSLDTYELQDGVDILVGRQNGVIEVFAFPEEDDTTPVLRFRHNCGESVSTVVGGIVGAVGYPEVLATTYSGRIFGLTTKPPGLLEVDQDIGLMTKLKIEIDQLEQKKNQQKESFDVGTDALAPPILNVNHRMLINKENASYTLSIELETSIDNILLQSDTPVDLLDVESNSAVASLSACDHKSGNYVLATYRCQINTNRLDLRLRTIEGQPGCLQIYVTSQVQPKCCRRIQIPIHALSFHSRIHKDENTVLLGGPFNELNLRGSFTAAEIHAWLSLALPDVPERPHLEDGEGTLIFTSTFVGTMLKCNYKKGNAIFLSENISSIIILRDILTGEATKRKIRLDVFCNIANGSISRVLDLVLPRIEAARAIKEKVKILDALQEWELNTNPEQLCSKYQKLLENESNLRAELVKDPDMLQRLYGTITDLYVDWERARGGQIVTSKTATEKLRPALESRDLTLLLQIFNGNNSAAETPVPQLQQN
ncbi:Bardet-Biedl syndrome 7 protein homolog isoform X1 [Neodiprion virginianus]|uniref:Bardet-Biedl syndrome 7 protein homolog isoform X1 n=2 Tax=Neodiprion virginianus TaxID=2961670 RepID=UPI001EE6FA30|nr:Bardet-Biedl syndrome 7 protein homolog isoform X1 [Neodiprion virginianus]